MYVFSVWVYHDVSDTFHLTVILVSGDFHSTVNLILRLVRLTDDFLF